MCNSLLVGGDGIIMNGQRHGLMFGCCVSLELTAGNVGLLVGSVGDIQLLVQPIQSPSAASFTRAKDKHHLLVHFGQYFLRHFGLNCDVVCRTSRCEDRDDSRNWNTRWRNKKSPGLWGLQSISTFLGSFSAVSLTGPRLIQAQSPWPMLHYLLNLN